MEHGRENEIDHIPAAEFAAPRSIDFSHGRYICIDGLYYAYLLIPSDGYKTQVPAGWLSLIVNAGDGIDMDMFLARSPKSASSSGWASSSVSTALKSKTPATPIQILMTSTALSGADIS